MMERAVPPTAARRRPELKIVKDPSIPQVDLACDDVLFNSVTADSQLKHLADGTPWRGPKEKSKVLMKLFVHGLTPENGIVADLTASTGSALPTISLLRKFHFHIISYCAIFYPGATIRAARACNRHILALESDAAIFNEVLKPMTLPPSRSPAAPDSTRILLHDDDEDEFADEPLENICE